MSRVFGLAALLGGMGAVALEVVYSRRLALLFGVTASAAAAVVAVYLAGMALGAALGGRAADRAGPRARRVYVLAEAGSGLWGLVFPIGYHLVDAPLTHLPAGWVVPAAFGATVLLVGPGAVLAGATFPALARVGGSIASVGQLYALNAAGAAAGAILAGIVLPDRIGLGATMLLAIGLNLSAACLVAFFGPPAPADPVPEPAPVDPPTRGQATAALAALGAVGMLSEVGWSRLLEQTGPNSGALCFPLMLSAYLFGLLLGGTWGVGWLRRAGDRVGLARALLIAGLACAAGVGALRLVPPEAIDGHIIGQGLGNGIAWDALGIYVSLDRLAFYLLAVALPGFASGAGFPIAAAALASGSGALGRPVGIASATGIVAGVLASAWMGILPSWGPGVVRMLAGAGLAAVILAVWLSRRRVWALAVPAAGAALLVPPWAGLQIPNGETVVAFVESASGPSAITTGAGVRVYTHGERVGGLALDLAVPLALHPQPSRVLTIAFGTGVNARRIAADPDITDLTVVDIDPSLPELASYNENVGPDLFDGKRTHYAVDDGRRLLRQVGDPYDIIYSDVATYAQYAELGTVEFFEVVRSRLADDGIFAVKLHLNTLTELGVRRFLAGVVEVFPQSWVFAERGPITVLVSTVRPAPIEALRERWARVDALYGPDIAGHLAMRALLGPAEIARWAEGPPQTDDRRTPWPQMLVGPFNPAFRQMTGLPGLVAHAAPPGAEVFPGLDPAARRVPGPPRGTGEVRVAPRQTWSEWLSGEVAPSRALESPDRPPDRARPGGRRPPREGKAPAP